ncbi:MAG: PEP-CTERM sorting domain-containing protein [Thermoguttaceae bacterium]|nr:PEP-CTERM sorting domain-containing protein [Thermoguttaceae bacterium]
MNFTFRNARLLAPVAALCLVALLTLSVNAEIIERAYNSTEEAVVGADDTLIIKGIGNDNTFSYNNYSGSGDVYFNPGGYSYFTTAIPDGYTNTKIFIAGNALGLQNSKTSSDVYGSGRILVLTNEVPTADGTTTVNEGTLFNANGSSPTYDNDIQIKGIGGLRVGWNKTLTVSGKISDYTDANGNVTPGKLIIEKDGTDIRITNWDNDYSGGTQIGGGNVTSGSNSTTLTIQTKPEGSTGTTPLGTGPIYFGSDNSKLDMGVYTLSISGVDNQKAAGGNYSGNTIVNNDNSMASPTFNVAEGLNLVYTGTLPTISGTLTKNGKGSQTIVTAEVDALNITAGTMGFSSALKANSVTLASGATLKMTGTGSSLTAANPIEIPNNATLYFENAVPRTTADLTINIAEGGALTFYETNTDGHNINNGLINSKTYNVSITGDGNLIKTGSGNLYMFSSANYNPALSIVLSDKAVIDVQDGFFINGGNYPDCWKATTTVGETTVTTYNQATLNVGPSGSVNLWDGTLYVGGITGGSLEGDKHGEINSPSYNGKIIVGAGITDADKRFVFNGNVDLKSGRTFTKEGAATQVVAGTFSSLGTTNVNGGTLEFSGTATLATLNFANNGKINVTQNGAATLTKEINFTKTTPINVASTATLILDPGDEKINSQTYTDSFVVPGTVVVKSGYFRTVDVSSPTKLQLDGGTLQNNGNNTGTSTSNINTDIYLASDSRLMAGWSGILNVNNTISGPGKLIIRDDSGVVYLYKSNTYEGGTQVGDSYKTNPAARLVAVTTNVLGTGRLYFGKAGASFDMAGYAQTIGGLGKDMNANETQYSGSVNNSGAETTLTIDVPEGETYNFNGSVAKNVSIVKKGEGTQQFCIANLANAKLFSDSIVVNAGRLDMKEYFVGTLGVEADAVFSPGNSVGTLNLTGDFNLNGGTLLMEIEGPTEADSDQLIIDGDLNFNGGNIVLDFVNGMTPNAEFAVVIDADNSDDPDFDILSHIDSYYFSSLSYGYGSGRWVLSGKVDANAVPEPSTWALLILGAAGLMYWRKRS